MESNKCGCSSITDDEELLNGLGSERIDKKDHVHNHMARTGTRWDTMYNQVNHSHNPGNKDKLESALDNVHKPIDIEGNVSPAQLYSTESGKLFHAGKILIVLAGLPATSKTALSVAITRYARWLGVRTESFHISKYRKERNCKGDDCYSAAPKTAKGKECRASLLKAISDDIVTFFQNTRGQLAVYDALNIRKEDRSRIQKQFSEFSTKVIFIESIVNDHTLSELNLQNAAMAPEFANCTKKETHDILIKRLNLNKPYYDELDQKEMLSYIKYIDFGQQILVNNIHGNYLINKIVFFLMNLRNAKGNIYFSRCGTSTEDKYINDEELNEEGISFSKKLTDVVMNRVSINQKHLDENEMTKWRLNSLTDSKPLHVFTAERKRTFDTGQFFTKEHNIPVYQRTELKQLRPGSVADLTDEEIRKNYPYEYSEYIKDPYHYRFPRAESYHDLAIRMEPFLLELERISGDILIIAHESTLRVLYGYFMASSCFDLGNIDFSRDELTEITISPFQNQVTRIPIDYK